MIVWTTTPWTLPSNLIVAASANLTYVKVEDKKTNSFHILAECRLKDVYKKKEDYKIVEKFSGKDLLA